MRTLKGFDAKYRHYFSLLVRRSQGPMTIEQASTILEVSYPKAKQILIRLAKSGWLFRIKKGLYIPVPAILEEGQPFVEDPWVIANALFTPCYIGGWDAVSHWDLTDQIFKNTFIYTQTPQKKSKYEYLNHTFIVHKVSKEQFFGLNVVWRESTKLMISDPSRTIIDFFDTPHFFGGSETLYEVLSEYLRSEHKDIDLLVDYALKMKNKAILKRLGFFLEYENLMTQKIERKFLENLSPGKAKLIPTQECPKLVTKWQLWVPNQWKENNK